MQMLPNLLTNNKLLGINYRPKQEEALWNVRNVICQSLGLSDKSKDILVSNPNLNNFVDGMAQQRSNQSKAKQTKYIYQYLYIDNDQNNTEISITISFFVSLRTTTHYNMMMWWLLNVSSTLPFQVFCMVNLLSQSRM